ncbi:endolytic transglycosylase MltG [Stenotrophobium rhamnosiphilum]|uniref:endolytic transglycosylase MltG n=1 Tax=Stenotrophobium rhamnosiphilum TaxID=2029166 RepID=UPI001F0D228E|nr:endolytic transglycosylase MltG [Stenotrophobium rhamnosiphilum]
MRALLTLVLLLVVSAVLIFQDAQTILSQPLQLTQKQHIDVVQGKAFSATLSQLSANNVFAARRGAFYLKVYARISGQATSLKAGEYELVPGMNSLDFLALIVSGKTVLHELRLIEGWTFEQALASIRANDELVHTLKTDDAEVIMAALGRSGIHAEGRFFPDTYFFPKGTTDEAFLRRALAGMDTVLAQEWEQREEGLPYQSPEQALVMASIIEKETGAPSERAEVAGVFVRRLVMGMKLQTDPTVIYGIGKNFDGNLRRSDLEFDTPYNTYTRMGLPPTPICLPGRASIHAALHPAKGDAIFFVARRDGTHQFSATLEQHNAAVNQFQRSSKSQGKPAKAKDKQKSKGKN